MDLHLIDKAIIGLYLVSTILIGVWVSRRASQGMESYFLGGRKLPWYVLSVSHASGMFDIAGTLFLVSLCFVYGMKSVWIPFMWPMFLHIFYMVYLAAWVRRSNVMTGAEWLKTRFNSDHGSECAHVSIVIWALISVVAFLAMAFKGIGKFAEVFFPWNLAIMSGGEVLIPSAAVYAMIFMGITTIYVVMGGMFSVVMTALVQYGLLTIASIAVAIIAMNQVSPDALSAVTPEGWGNIGFGWTLDTKGSWAGILDSIESQVAGDNLFGILFVLMLLQGFFKSASMPAPNYDAQRLLATKGPRESSLMSGIVSFVVLVPRYFLIMGVTVLALVHFVPEWQASGAKPDFEQVLPYVLSDLVPIGLKGLLLAGLVAAFMSTFDSTLNAGAAYFVNDVYKRYLKKDASEKACMKLSYIMSFLLVIVGMAVGLLVKSVGSITLWISVALWGGFAAANMLKYYWWRLNGYGYFWGMISGSVTAVILKLSGDFNEVFVSFPILFTVALLASIIGSYATKPEKDEVLMAFYKNVRPWGFWGPVRDKVMAADPSFVPNRNFKRDMVNCSVGIVWQTTFMALPMYLVIKQYTALGITAGITFATTLFLKKNWYDKLERD
jgi:Na+/proline symporter